MSSQGKFQRRDFMKGMAGLAGAGVLASCAPKATPAPASTAASGGETAATAAPAIKYADEACIHRHLKGGYTGEGPDDYLVKEIQEQALRDEYGLNVDIQIESAPWSDIDTLMTTRMETQACDSLERGSSYTLNWMAEPGLLQDMEEALQEYGQNLEQVFPSASFDYFRKEGKRYSVASFYTSPVDCEYVSIRRDWCDKVDREVPTTLDELEECLRLFKENNLGGEMTLGACAELGGWMMPSYVMQGPFAPEPDEQLAMIEAGENFEYELGCAMRPERLEMMQRWHKDGLINPEWPTFTSEDTSAAIDRGICGVVLCGHWFQGHLDQVERDIDPSQDWVHIFPPLGLKDKPNSGRILTEVPLRDGLTVTSWAPCPEAAVALCDWMNSSFENYMLCTRGIEGKHWEWGENGCYVDLRTDPPAQEYSSMRWIVEAPKWQAELSNKPSPPGQEPKDPNIAKRILGPHIYNRVDTKVPQANEYPTLTRLFHFVPWDFKESAKYDADFLALRDEHFTKIVKGEVEVQAGVQAFWDQWFAAGGDVRQREISDQYAAYIAEYPEMSDPNIFFSPDSWNTTSEYPDRPES